MVGMGKINIIPTSYQQGTLINHQQFSIGYWLMMGKHGYPTSRQ
jgi:hypothetical protein